MSALRPIEIIGGGLAGLSLGLALRRENIPVTVHEAGTYPRHRVCGEFITGLPEKTRQRLGLDELLAGAAPNQSVAWYANEAIVRHQTLPQIAPGLSRYTLDARLADAFQAAGGSLLTRSRWQDFRDAPGRVFSTGRRRATSPWLGLKVHAIEFPLAADLELHLGRDAYVGLARIENGRVNICGLFRRRPVSVGGVKLLFQYLELAGLTALAGRLRNAPIDTASFSAVAAVDFDRRVPAVSQVRIGDTLAMIPPFTGHGMAMAFQSAEIALSPLVAFSRGNCSWDETSHEIQSSTRRRFRLRLASASALHSFLHQPSRQRWLGALNRARLLPLRPLYAVLH
jgi:2-polyprenyl-6-methoxyphenol hydroxylase-like FAD-dependent oxidoreductase